MKKKYIRLVVMVIAVVLVLSVASTAFADGGFYYGRYKSGFTANQTFNKITDRKLEDDNESCRTGSYTGNETDYRSYLMINGKDYSYALLDNGQAHSVVSEDQGTAGMRVAAVSSKESHLKYIRGRFYLYGGNTERRITDWSNYWG